MSRSDAIAILNSTPAVLASLLSGIGDNLTASPLDGDWAAKDIVAHLIITDRLGTISRIIRVLEQAAPRLPAFDEHDELEKSGLRSESLSELVEQFTRMRLAGMARIAGLDDPAFLRTGTHGEVGELTVEDLLFHAAYHDSLHLRQLLQMLEGYFEPLRGPMRAF